MLTGLLLVSCLPQSWLDYCSFFSLCHIPENLTTLSLPLGISQYLKRMSWIIWGHCLPKMAKVCATGTIKLITPLPLDTDDIFSLPWLPPSIFEDGLRYSGSRNMCSELVSHSPCTGCCRDWWLFCPGHSSGFCIIHWIPAYLFADKASIR